MNNVHEIMNDVHEVHTIQVYVLEYFPFHFNASLST